MFRVKIKASSWSVGSVVKCSTGWTPTHVILAAFVEDHISVSTKQMMVYNHCLSSF